ncbi:uncharacterized protein LOC111830985 [Capsella rubella]|uniref:uncharacterized protein LOC111830985 n=1 Tax=Capsella rubella TaxID=81985 RepID=UPI000CD50F1F|nr:uncharacterized protein LOC111830985 [Capsella rubella]
MSSRMQPSQRRAEENSWSLVPPLNLILRSRQDFLQHMAEDQRRYDFTSPSYTLDYLPRLNRHAHFLPTGNRSEGLESNSPEAGNKEFVIPLFVDVSDLWRAPGRSHLLDFCQEREGKHIWYILSRS